MFNSSMKRQLRASGQCLHASNFARQRPLLFSLGACLFSSGKKYSPPEHTIQHQQNVMMKLRKTGRMKAEDRINDAANRMQAALEYKTKLMEEKAKKDKELKERAKQQK
mmetsp:Transcript_10571/g.20026  ORF Transcript_10571/g.20026 Transcript_10571/m.20026 type:complete len:109 (+) Transcript_10571:66-392(+)|eukprot:CAMPEP_0175151114 /NCGR_PEP_ID=MMETSP0087-20121206/18295_1 /TAXON_ID=136419 /ORGANISM="Unknown Unknown, Strain D1" /LENGTH=108 /DNA_ID=CAMNT_0016437233 /DNA_START=61 /DNA_END=387 /DNA_ORIENTATION=-